ncbi:MAG TPA: PBP1A family penicillin-binding protein [Longimicrobiales bacterium]|nr:PBP1A family penicillin-binding protein [Longimicrobiales bacterium]
MNPMPAALKPLFAALLALSLAALPARAQDCPSLAAFRQYRPPEATRVFAIDGSRIADLSHERRVVIGLGDVPASVSRGFVAVEDRRFWRHDGVDVRGVGRALLRNLRSRSLEEGFSTITMQLARNVFPEELPRTDKLRRKLCEVQLAGVIEEHFSKREILERYLNQVYMGDGLYGVEEAARGYFGKPVRDVSLGEAALLVGLVKNPEGYNPRKQPRRAIQRRNVVLDVMAREQVITAAAAARAKREPLALAEPLEASGPAPYYVAAIRRELRERFGGDAAIQGLRVYTGLDPAMQRAAHEILLAQIRSIESGAHGRYRHPVPGGKLPPAEGSGSPYLQGVVVLLDSRTGEVRALVGGRDFSHSSYDRALLARRQPGSAFKPIVYAAALEAGMSAADRIETTPVSVANAGAVAWRPDDLVPDSIAQLSVRDALALSSNHAAVRVGTWVGAEQVAAMARKLGIRTPVPAYPSIFLGAAEVVPAELAAAYAVLGNGGRAVTPTLITRVEDARGKLLWAAPTTHRQVIDAGVAYLTTSMLEDAVDRGTGSAVRRLGFYPAAAGKTGTTNDAKDVWFVGMTTELTGAVWLGFDQPATITSGAFGGSLAAPVWADLMKRVYRGRPAPGRWTPPAHLVQLPVDGGTGLLATSRCPLDAVRTEYFLPGTEPAEFCPLHPEGSAVGRLLRRIF